MAKQVQIKEIRVNNELIQVAGETAEITLGRGESSYESFIAGGGSSKVVSGLDTSTQVGSMKFDIPHIAGYFERCQDWHDKRGENLVRLVDTNDEIYTLEEAGLVGDTALSFSADGKISIEFKGNPIK